MDATAYDGAPGFDAAPPPDTKPVTSELLLYDGKDYFPESCADQVAFSGTGEFLGKKLVVSAGWKNANVLLVFAHPERFLIRTVLRGPSGCNVITYNVTGSCWNLWPDYQNMQYRVTIVMLAKGDTFSGWSDYP